MEEEFCSNTSSPSGLPSSSSTATNSLVSSEKKEKKNERFRYGNFNRYYGVRTKGFDHDLRLDILPKEWFNKKRILDVGCNAGHLTLEIAKELKPSWILGIDIDDHLIGVARKNIRHYFECNDDEKGQEFIGKFPASIKNYNVWFSRENYVLESDEYLEMIREEYDPEMFETYKNIKFKPDQFKNYLIEEVGFVECQQLGIPKAVTRGFERPILVFQKAINLNSRKRQFIEDKQENDHKLPEKKFC
uniref:RNA methyltransferase n=1 Tax=Meloidogyne javanica TaxID=6303 RepID=A0A915MIP0_MELJA